MTTDNDPLTLTEEAAKQIIEAAAQSGTPDTAIRFAVEKLDSGQLRYAMGFDDIKDSEDVSYQSQGVSIVVATSSVELLQGTTMDFVELDSGEKQFVFLNPNDPNYKPG